MRKNVNCKQWTIFKTHIHFVEFAASLYRRKPVSRSFKFPRKLQHLTLQISIWAEVHLLALRYDEIRPLLNERSSTSCSTILPILLQFPANSTNNKPWLHTFHANRPVLFYLSSVLSIYILYFVSILITSDPPTYFVWIVASNVINCITIKRIKHT